MVTEAFLGLPTLGELLLLGSVGAVAIGARTRNAPREVSALLLLALALLCLIVVGGGT